MDREAQIEAIERTFEDVKIPMEEHYSKKGVYPVEVIPILPDSDMWKFPCAQVFANLLKSFFYLRHLQDIAVYLQ